VELGIGSVQGTNKINESINRLSSEYKNISVEVYFEPDELVNDLNKGIIKGAVRGSLPAGDVLTCLKSIFKKEELMRINLLKTADSKYFFIAPVGIDECGTLEQKLELVEHASNWLGMFSIVPEIAVLSGGRSEDLGRSKDVDATLEAAENLTSNLKERGFNATDFGILIEDAVRDSNLLIVPDGIIGNFIFRTIYHLGGGDSLGAPVVNLPEVFVDTSRSKDDYSSALLLAAALATGKSRQSND
jgi:putative methanogen marker protein 4